MNNSIQRHTLWQTIGLHLIPGMFLTIFYILSAPLVAKAGYPTYMAILLAIFFVLIPVELGILLNEGKRKTGRFTLDGIVLNREQLPLWQYIVFGVVLIGWCGLVFVGLSDMDAAIIRQYFSWIPSVWMLNGDPEILSQFPRTAVVVTIIAGLLLNGIAGPVVEELYFRGYLLPRIPSSRAWAPVINAVLFSLYHFFSPWQNITRILALLPMVYAVSWKRNIYLSIVVHCSINIIGMLPLIPLLAG
ncbi:MAG: CPBP family intramembrane metalloprotease [Leptolinea sp.]|nr:CPBP family intramembrane metalloprotease [Leptolinea sp.]